MATDPTFATTPREVVVQVTTANTARDGSGSPVAVLTGVAAGTRVDEVRFVATGTTTAGVLRLFLSTDGGTTKRLLLEMLVTAVTPSTTATVWTSGIIGFPNLQLASANHILYASTHNSETFNVFATGADF